MTAQINTAILTCQSVSGIEPISKSRSRQTFSADLSQVVSASPGDSLTFSIYAKADVSTGFQAQAIISFYTSLDVEISTQASTLTILTTTYQQLTVSHSEASGSVAKARRVIYVGEESPALKSTRQAVYLYVDDASLTGDVVEFPVPILTGSAIDVIFTTVILLKRNR
ncbi:MAG: hypothetical protein ACFFBD_13375 [Candidatus Hodarchaeota archaeon]